MKCNLKGCERTDEHEHGQSAYTAAGQTRAVKDFLAKPQDTFRQIKLYNGHREGCMSQEPDGGPCTCDQGRGRSIEDDFRKMVGRTLDNAFDPGPGGYWAYLDEALEAADAREATDNDLVALFRADGKSWVVAMPRGVYYKFAKAGKDGKFDEKKFDELLAETAYKPGGST